MDKAGYPVSQIAEELGRTEATIRNHLGRKTEAGKLVWETYEMLLKGKADPVATVLSAAGDAEKFKEELEKVVRERDELKQRVSELEEENAKLRSKLSEIRKRLEETLSSI